MKLVTFKIKRTLALLSGQNGANAFKALLLLGDDSVAVAVGFLGGQVKESEDSEYWCHEVE